MATPLMLFAGSRPDAGFVFTGGQLPTIETGNYNPTYSDSSIGMSNGQVQALAQARDASGTLTSVGAGHTFSCHVLWYNSRGVVTFGVPLCVLYDSSLQPWLRLIAPNGDGITHLQYNSGTGGSPSWTDVATYPSWNGYLDLSVKIDAGGNHNVLWAINASTAFTGTISMAGMTNLASVQYLSIDFGGTTFISEVMVAQDIALINAHVKTLRAVGAGNYSQWSGSASDVNEIGQDDSNFNRSATANQSQSYDMTTLTLPVNYTIGGLFYAFRARNDGFTPPTNVKGLLRIAATDYLSPNLSPINPAFGNVQYRWDLNPNTGVAWTEANINAMELGFKSIT